MSTNTGSSDDSKPGRKPREVFLVYASVSGRAATFEEPREAGRAFFMADPAERPSVTHTVGNGARTIARTEIHGVHPGGEARYFKSLPASHAPDAAFREGFLEAMEQSLKERLGKVASVKEPGHGTNTDRRLHDDLEAFAYRAPTRAVQLWSDHGTDLPPGPVLKAVVDAYVAAVGRGTAVGPAGEEEVAASHLRGSGRVQAAESRHFNQASEDWER